MIRQPTRSITFHFTRSFRCAFVKRTGEVVFAGLAAMASGRMVPAFATAGTGGGPPTPTVPACSPPGPYCNLNGVNEPNGCHGGSCFQHLNAGQVVQCHLWQC